MFWKSTLAVGVLSATMVVSDSTPRAEAHGLTNQKPRVQHTSSRKPKQHRTTRASPKRHPSKKVHASYYGSKFHGRKMANGKPFNMYANTVAHKNLPLGTKIVITNLETSKTVQAVVTDRGPYIKGRDLDVSAGLAKKLGFITKGHTDLIMQVVALPKES